MGCDIHMCVEFKRGNEWVNVDHYRADHDFDQPVYHRVELYDGRSYHMFGQLAGVRRDDVPRIADPRGVPSDVHPVTRDAYENWEDDGHSASWVTLADIVDFKVALRGDEYTLERIERRLTDRLAECAYGGYEKDYDKIRIVFWFDN